MFELNEALSKLLQRPKRTLGILLLAIIGLLSIGISYSLDKSVHHQKKDYDKKYSEKHFYTISDNYVGDNELEISDESISILRRVNDKLTNSEDFDYYMMYDQPVYLEKADVNEGVIYGYEYGANSVNDSIQIFDEKTNVTKEFLQVKGFWLDEKYINDYGLNLSEGELFETEDYENGMAVILGDSYKDKFKVGDKIYIDFFFYRGEVTVKGFADKGTNVYYNSKFTNLDNYVIVPMLKSTGLEGRIFTLYFMYMKNSGLIVTDKTEKSLQKIINEYERDLGIGNVYYIKEYGTTEVNTMTINLQRVVNVVRAIAGMIIATIMIIMIIYYWKTFKLSRNYFSVLIINGCTYKNIKKILILENVVITILGYIFGGALVYIANVRFKTENNLMLYGVLLVAICMCEFIPLICTSMVFFRKDLAEYLKEEIVE